MPTTKAGNFVNVIATIDRVNHIGKILYVNPTSISVIAAAAPPSPAPNEGGLPDPFDGYELSLQDADGRELERVPAAVQLSACDEKIPETALIQQDLVFKPGMQQIALLRNGLELDRFVAGTPDIDANAGMDPAFRAPSIVASASTKPHRIPLHVDPAPASEAGVSYTAQVRPSGTTAWHTIAVGIDTPRMDLDRNQFAGSPVVVVRFLRTNGFVDQTLAEQDIYLDQ